MNSLPPLGERLLDRYQLESLVGRGGMGAVFKAKDTLLAQTVAVKVLFVEGLAGSQGASVLLDSLRNEAIASMRLSHPNIVRVFNFEVCPPWDILIMEFIAGESVASYRRRFPNRRLPLSEVVRIGDAVLQGLAHAHEAGIVHYDLKPANIMLTRIGGIKTCDFGLSRIMRRGPQHEESRKRANVLTGTPSYMPPELILGREGDHRSDFYSLAATLYDLATGQPPFGRGSEAALVGHVKKPVPPHPDLPEPFFRVLATAMEKRPERRFASAEAMRIALLAAASQVGSSSLAAPRPEATGAPQPQSEVIEIDFSDLETFETVTQSRPPVEPPPPPPLREPSRPGATGERLGPEAAPQRQAPINRPERHRPVEPQEVVEEREEPEEPPEDMVLIPGGTFESRYSSRGAPVEVEPFFLDRVPVTNEHYARFVEETGHAPPDSWLRGAPPEGKLDHPVVEVTLEDAMAYARWLGRRLPTPAEWEAAATALGSRQFPWGDEFDPSRCNGRESGVGDTTPVTEHESGASPQGVLDLVGNVWEWTDPSGQEVEPGSAWAFGGSYRHPCVKEGAIARTSVNGNNAYKYLGFRCAKSPRGSGRRM